jgi:pectin methylesterase-like acyl-CoA thioesterase
VRRMIAFALVGGLALTACSSNDSKTLDARRTASKVSTTSTTAPFASATAHTPGSLRNFEGARTDVHDTSCTLTSVVWKATGRITNPTGDAVRYRIYVSFLDGDTTVGITEADPGPVAGHETQRWTAKLPVSTPGLRCILRVERAGA